MFRDDDRRGFTLVEWLLAITIMGISIALLLPAIQAARSDAVWEKNSREIKPIPIGSNNTLLATADFDDMIGTIARQGVIMPGVCLEVAYAKGLFYGVTKGTSVDLYTSSDGTDWELMERPLFDNGINVDRGRDLKMLGENLLWFTYRDTKLPTMGIASSVFDLRSSKKIQKDFGLALSPVKETPVFYNQGVDSPTLFEYAGKWYMYIAAQSDEDSTAGGSNDYKVVLFEWEEGT